jgi:hypothetical protein
LSEHESLTSIAEFAIALAGFSGIVVALGKQPGRWAAADRFRLLNVLVYAFTVGFMAYLPMGLAHAGLAGSLLWRVSSGGFLCVLLIESVLFLSVIMRAVTDEVRILLNPIIYWTSWIFFAIVMLAQLLNILGLGFQPQFAPYFLGLVLSLLAGSSQFVRILFARPE